MFSEPLILGVCKRRNREVIKCPPEANKVASNWLDLISNSISYGQSNTLWYSVFFISMSPGALVMWTCWADWPSPKSPEKQFSEYAFMLCYIFIETSQDCSLLSSQWRSAKGSQEHQPPRCKVVRSTCGAPLSPTSPSNPVPIWANHNLPWPFSA